MFLICELYLLKVVSARSLSENMLLVYCIFYSQCCSNFAAHFCKVEQEAEYDLTLDQL